MNLKTINLDNLIHVSHSDYLNGLTELITQYKKKASYVLLKSDNLFYNIKFDTDKRKFLVIDAIGNKYTVIQNELRLIDDNYNPIDEPTNKDKSGNCVYCGKYENIFDGYCKECIRYYSSEKYLCKTCLANGEFNKGFTRWDSLVLCEKHTNEFMPSISKLYEILGVN